MSEHPGISGERVLGYLISLVTFCWAFWLVYHSEADSRSVIIAVILYMIMRAMVVEILWLIGADNDKSRVRLITKKPAIGDDFAGNEQSGDRRFIGIIWVAATICGLMAFTISRGSNVELWGEASGTISFTGLSQELYLGFLIACCYLASRLLHRFPMAWNSGIGASHAANAMPAAVLMLVMFTLLAFLLVGGIFDLTFSHWWVSGVTLFYLSVMDEDWKPTPADPIR